MSDYPTWKRVSAKEWRSEEERNGVPDFWLSKEDTSSRPWRLKWRTSAMVEWFASAATARKSVTDAMATATPAVVDSARKGPTAR